jgi:hypothetical protein
MLAAVPDNLSLTNAQALHAIRRIRAISWRWRMRKALLHPRLLLGLGRRHYGVAAQDVDQQLGQLVPGIILCQAGWSCARHGGNPDRDAGCTGVIMVHYGLLEEVVEQAAQELSPQIHAAAQHTRLRRDRGLQRRCYDRIVAIQVHAARLAQKRGMDSKLMLVLGWLWHNRRSCDPDPLLEPQIREHIRIDVISEEDSGSSPHGGKHGHRHQRGDQGDQRYDTPEVCLHVQFPSCITPACRSWPTARRAGRWYGRLLIVVGAASRSSCSAVT